MGGLAAREGTKEATSSVKETGSQLSALGPKGPEASAGAEARTPARPAPHSTGAPSLPPSRHSASRPLCPSWLATAAAGSEGCGQEKVNLWSLPSAWRAPKAHRLGTWAPTSVGGAET